jgi:hydroxyethylthiazole kinase-like uncharacterized protein yjeF
MKPVLCSEQIKKLETQWAEQHSGSTWSLMQQAAESFVALYASHWSNKNVTVVVGTGNNGGDGYYVAWLLQQQGAEVSVFAPFGMPDHTIDAQRAYELYCQTSAPILDQWPERTDIVIDALFGIGLNRTLNDDAINLIEQINKANVEVFSIDLPSGLNAQTGVPMPVAIKADYTLSMIAYKPGLLTAYGPAYCGQLELATLGIESHSDSIFNDEWPQLIDKSGNSHKSLFGSVSVLGGNHKMAGAAVLAGHAALKAGAGRVMVHCDAHFQQVAISQAPELMVKVLGKSPLMVGENHALVVGPGLGRSVFSSGVLQEAILSAPQYGGVVDADGLRILANQMQKMTGWVLTPHAGEAAALLGITSQQVQADRVSAVKQIALKYQSVVVLKGAGTLVSNGTEVIFCHQGHGAMATPGMGDVLAGMVGAFLAQGRAPMDAAVSAVNWHAKLGCLIAKTQHSVFASDIIKLLALQPSD